MNGPVHTIKSNFDKILQTIKSLELDCLDEEGSIPKSGNALTVEAWITLDVYPCNVAPIVHYSEDFGAQGFCLGIDVYGHLLFTASGQTTTSKMALELYRCGAEKNRYYNCLNPKITDFDS